MINFDDCKQQINNAPKGESIHLSADKIEHLTEIYYLLKEEQTTLNFEFTNVIKETKAGQRDVALIMIKKL